MTDNSFLRDIAARASFLFERRDYAFNHAGVPDEALLESRRQIWSNALDEFDRDAAWEKYTGWLQLGPDDIQQMLSPVHLVDGAPLPAWAETLGKVLDEAFQYRAVEPVELAAESGASENAAPARDIPFGEFFSPFVNLFHKQISACPGWHRLDHPAQLAIEQSLVARLSSLAVETLYFEFNALRNRQPFGALMIAAAKSGKLPEQKLYRKFMAGLLAGGMADFFTKYPVLARLMGMTLQLLGEAYAEFLQRLEADLPEIAHRFGINPAATVSTLRASLSDSHAGGRSVVGLTFSGGCPLIYKPKPMGMELAYNQLLAWLEEHGSPLDLKPLKVLDGGTYGWVEFAAHDACRDQEAVQRYYRRMGMLLCLVYALEGTDCHIENIVASGEYPLLIDSETLFHHRVMENVSAEVAASAAYQTEVLFNNSVSRSGLLPGWIFGKDRKVAFDISGIGGEAGQALPYRRQKLGFINTDAMQVTYESGTLKQDANLPLVDGLPVTLADHAPAVVDGFSEMYAFLMAQRQALLQNSGPLDAFRGQHSRFVFRNTRVYALLLQQATQPKYLRDGLDYSLYLERLGSVFLQLEEKPPFLEILQAERQAMYRSDIPFFSAEVVSDDLKLDPACDIKSIPHYFIAPSFDNVLNRLKNFSAQDLEEQSYVIQLALQSRLAVQEHSQSFSGTSFPPSGEAVIPPSAALEAGPVNHLLNEAAISLARLTQAQAKRGTDGSAAWIGPLYLEETGRFQLNQLPQNLYDGTGGVAVFLAALCQPGFSGQMDDGERAGLRELCLGALKTGRSLLAQDNFEQAVAALGVGGGVGIGSIIYALALCGHLLEEEDLLKEAQAAACRLTYEQAAADQKLDVIFGLGGMLLSLLSVYEKTHDAGVLERAIWCGQLLLEKRSPTATGYRAWKTTGAEPLSGFSHGTAGIVCGLLRLHQATGDEKLYAAAEEAIAYENTLYDPAMQNWKDLRPKSKDIPRQDDSAQAEFQTAWCHGAPGIGLSRLAGLKTLDTPQVRQDIEHALATTRQAMSYISVSSDHLCCGNLGRIDLLVAASQRLQRPDLLAEAHRYSAQVVENAARQGYAYSAGMPRGLYTAGFFQGASGIGYQLLRVLNPARIPDVLLWE